MRIKPGAEDAYAEFSAEQCKSEDGQTMLNFMEAWSDMMEFAIDHGVGDISEAAGITLAASVLISGAATDDTVISGGRNLLNFWEHGEGLRELLTYHPPEILYGSLDASLTVWYASQELLAVLPDIVDEYPEILHSAPDILQICQVRMNEEMSSSYPEMSM